MRSFQELDTAARRVAKVVAPLRELDVACRRLAVLEVSPEGRASAIAIEAARSTLLARWRRQIHPRPTPHRPLACRRCSRPHARLAHSLGALPRDG